MHKLREGRAACAEGQAARQEFHRLQTMQQMPGRRQATPRREFSGCRPCSLGSDT
jgi:hypothetical protein